jgi:hypothetical protein
MAAPKKKPIKKRSDEGRVAPTKKGMDKAVQGRVKKGEIINPGRLTAKAAQSKAARTYIEKSKTRIEAGLKAKETRKANIAADKRKSQIKGAGVGAGLGLTAGYTARQAQENPRKALRKGRGLGR